MKIKDIFDKKKSQRKKILKPYIVAEIGVNHEGSLDKAKEMVELIKEGGGDAAKFQSYKASSLASKNSPAYWDLEKEPTESQYKLFKKYDKFGKSEYLELAKYCKKIGIDFLSTPFDDNAIEFLTPIVPFFKIASADITNIPFLRKIAEKEKPMVISTGASTIAEIETAVREVKEHGCKKIALLHCILNYPTPDKNANLKMIQGIKKTFPEVIVGYSDHTLPDRSMLSLTTAFLLGAQIIEKHFTFDKTLQGNDHYHSMDINDLKVFVKNIDKLVTILGEKIKQPLSDEEISRKNARRSIVTKRKIKKGTILTENDLTYKRPAFGISPAKWDDVLGKKVIKNLDDDHILIWDDIE